MSTVKPCYSSPTSGPIECMSPEQADILYTEQDRMKRNRSREAKEIVELAKRVKRLDEAVCNVTRDKEGWQMSAEALRELRAANPQGIFLIAEPLEQQIIELYSALQTFGGDTEVAPEKPVKDIGAIDLSEIGGLVQPVQPAERNIFKVIDMAEPATKTHPPPSPDYKPFLVSLSEIEQFRLQQLVEIQRRVNSYTSPSPEVPLSDNAFKLRDAGRRRLTLFYKNLIQDPERISRLKAVVNQELRGIRTDARVSLTDNN